MPAPNSIMNATQTAAPGKEQSGVLNQETLSAAIKSAVHILITRDMVRPSYINDFAREKPIFIDKLASALSLYDPLQTGEYIPLPARELLSALALEVRVTDASATLSWYDLCLGVLHYRGVEIHVYCTDDQETWAIDVPGIQKIPPLRSNYFLQPHLLYAFYLIDNVKA